MKCNKCGNEILEDSVFCTNCGNKIEQRAKEQVKVDNNINQNDKKKKDKGLNITALIIILIICIPVLLIETVRFIPTKEKIINKNFSELKVKDPLGHTIKIEASDVYIRKVNLEHLWDERRTLLDNSEKITKEEIENLKISKKQKEVVEEAIIHLSYSPESYEGLIEALEYRKYDKEFIMYAVDNCKADWKEQAHISAISYLSSGSMSKKRIKEMLEYEKFTEEQVLYAMKKIEDKDFYEQAVESSLFNRYSMKYTKENSRKYLIDDGFSEEEADFATKVVYEEMN